VSLRNFSLCPYTYSLTIHPTTSSLLACGAFCGKVSAQFFFSNSQSEHPKFSTLRTSILIPPLMAPVHVEGYKFSQLVRRYSCGGIWECKVTDIHGPTDFRKNRPFEDTTLMFIWSYTSGDRSSR